MMIFFSPVSYPICIAGLAELQALASADNLVICRESHLSPVFWTTIPGAELQVMGDSLNNQGDEAGEASYLMDIPGLFDWGRNTGVVWPLKGPQGWSIDICLVWLKHLPPLVQRLIQTVQPDRLLHSYYVIPTGVTL